MKDQNKESGRGEITVLFSRSLFQNSGHAEEDSLEDDKGCSKLGHDTKKEIWKELEERVDEAMKEGQSI